MCSSPWLIAAYHVLLRLHAPRHPPCALSSLPILWPIFYFRLTLTRYVTLARLTYRPKCLVSSSYAYSAVKEPRCALAKVKHRSRENLRWRARGSLLRYRMLERAGREASFLADPRGIDVSKLGRRVRGQEASERCGGWIVARREASIGATIASFRKEVIQPQVLLQLPCYDFTPIINHTVVTCLPCGLAQLLLVQPTFVM